MLLQLGLKWDIHKVLKIIDRKRNKMKTMEQQEVECKKCKDKKNCPDKNGYAYCTQTGKK